jgi:CO dehydrogenase maturation factor
MKIAVTGKGGVGKTSFVALLGSALQKSGNSVLYIDADPDMNLATVLQVPENISITPIVELKELIAERTGVQPGQPAPLFKMNPKVDDIPDTYCVQYAGFKLMAMGTIKKGGGGCACPENAFLKSLLAHLVIARNEWVLLDMEAGIEHLGRGTAIGVDHLVIVVEPNKTSIETAHRILSLSRDINIRSVYAVGNKIQDDDDVKFLQDELSDFGVLGYIGYSKDIRDISLRKSSPESMGEETYRLFKGIVEKLEMKSGITT